MKKLKLNVSKKDFTGVTPPKKTVFDEESFTGCIYV